MIRFEGEFRMWYEVQHLTISRFREMISFYFDYFSNFKKVRKRKMLFAMTKSYIRYLFTIHYYLLPPKKFLDGGRKVKSEE